MPLNKFQQIRYLRNIALEDIGSSGQERLLNSSVLIVGLGGLGSPCALYLAAAGVGHLGLCDFDKVDLSNLQRQIIHFTNDINRPKTASAKDKINELNPDIKITEHAHFSPDLIRNYDFIIDATDNFDAKFSINSACISYNKPFVHAGVLRYIGQAITIIPKVSACLSCIYTHPKELNFPKMDEFKAGLFGVLPGIFGVIQASEAIKFLLQKHELLTDCLLKIDTRNMNFHKIEVKRRENCPICA
ncbi:MAG: HesA/MoeB/ThiF family protein [Helicobacter sp.]|nr:HesA/MoeB/ThiF family protein [Helicobacter sp.]